MKGLLFRSRWPASSLDKDIVSIDVEDLANEFDELVKKAPRRSDRKPYFECHTRNGVIKSRKPSNRPEEQSNPREEHLAIALWNSDRRWPRADGGWSRLLDYQVPLKARQANKDIGKIGKIDLLGITDQGRLIIHELKVKRKSKRKPPAQNDAPPRALMEGLCYTACVQADLEAIVEQARRKFGVEVPNDKPIVQVVAPVGWWEDWFGLCAADAWGPVLADLSKSLTDMIDVPIEYVAFEDVKIKCVETESGSEGTRPQISQAPRFFEVELRQSRVGRKISCHENGLP